MRSLVTFIASLLSLTMIYSQTWIRQNPFPELSVLQDVYFEGLNGIAVGTESTILTTTNGGINWIPRQAPQVGSFFQSAIIVPGTNGQLMFAGGYQLIVSHDGGVSWDYTSAPTQLVYKIQVLSDGTILVLDSNTGLLSKDNGETWNAFSLPGMNTSAGHFTNEMNGWVVFGGFNDNQVWVTSDGGESWALRDPLKHPVVSELWMIDDQLGFLGSRDFVYKTTNGGNTWVQLNDNPVNSIRDMEVVNENEIWTCLNNGFVFYTLDGGANWTEINPNIISSNQTAGLYANAEGKVWVAGKYVSIMYTDDYGMDWMDQVPNSKGIMYSPYFFDENIGIIGSSEGTVLKTINGGASFEKMQLGPDEYFFASQMISEHEMVVGSSSGKVFATSNQGDTWTLIGENLGEVKDVHAFNLQSIVTISEEGKIYKTENGGTQWDEVYSGNPDLLLGLEFVDEQRGWVCGWFGQILHTVDGGRQWASQYHDGSTQFSDIHFTTANEGWAISDSYSDSIWHTTNGGDEWMSLPLPYQTYWQSVSFTSQDTGWITGGSAGSGIILRTNNGGQSWIEDHYSPEAFFGLYAIPGKETAWATGLGGNIVKYSPCTFNPMLSDLSGEEMPCQYDTVTYTVNSSGVDIFEWSFPSDWLIFGNPNTSSVQVLIGSMAGPISVSGSDVCGNVTGEFSIIAYPIANQQAIITDNEGELTCNLSSGSYQWLRNGVPISGATLQIFTPLVSGTYAVVVTSPATGCEAKSNSIEILISSVAEMPTALLKIFPNPANEILCFSPIDGSEILSESEITIIAADGRIFLKESGKSDSVDTSNFPEGIYILNVRTDRHLFQELFVINRTK